MRIQNHTFERVLIIADDTAACDSYKGAIADLGLEPRQMPGPLDDVSSIVKAVEPTDVLLCYSSFNGDHLLVHC